MLFKPLVVLPFCKVRPVANEILQLPVDDAWGWCDMKCIRNGCHSKRIVTFRQLNLLSTCPLVMAASWLPPLSHDPLSDCVYHKKWQICATFCSCWIKDWAWGFCQAPGWAAIRARFQVTANITHTRRGPHQLLTLRTQSQLAIIKLRRDISF